MTRLLVLTTAVLTFALAPPASAADPIPGEYNVQACFEDRGIGNGAWVAHAPQSAYVTAYTSCPGEGIVTRMSGGSGNAPQWSGAEHMLTAPPGTRITRLWGDFRFHSQNGWAAGFIDDSDWVWCGTGCTSFGSYWNTNIWLDTPKIRAHVVCLNAGGCPRADQFGILAMKNVTVTIKDPTPPSVAITGGTVLEPRWQNGDQTIQVSATDATGLRALRLSIDGGEVSRNIPETCSDATPRPCADLAGVRTFPVSAFGSDGRKSLVIRAQDGGYNWSEIRKDVWIDTTAPGQPLDARLENGDGWRARNGFSVAWRNPMETASPIGVVRYMLCPSGNLSGDRSGCAEGSNRQRDVSALTDLRVPKPGEWRLSLWLGDEAGNSDRERAVTVGTLRFDDDAPTVRLAPQDDDDPTLVRALVSDTTSGIADGQIEARRDGEDAWRTLSTRLDASGLTATLDDGQLPRGRYELRARVVDRAGNERSTQTQTSGDTATRMLPLRVGTRLVVGAPKKIRARNSKGKWRTRTVLRVNPRAHYGRTIALRGRLTMPGANPLADADIEVWERVKVPGADWRRVSVVRTSRTGRFQFKALRGPSRVLRFRYPGTAKLRSRSMQIELGVRAMTSFRVSRHSVVNGEEVRFHGRLKGRQTGDTGKVLYVQVYTRGRWSTFATPRANRETGLWSLPYRFSATRGVVMYRFRVLIPRETSFPYETGRSRSVRVKVRGL
jgi:hypothetical protein